MVVVYPANGPLHVAEENVATPLIVQSYRLTLAAELVPLKTAA